MFPIPASPLVVSRFPSRPPQKTKFSFLSLSFQPCTVAVSSFQPSSAAPTSWLTHFCSEVTGFLADFQRVGLTNPYAAFRTVLPPRSWLCSLQVSCVLTTLRVAWGANSAGWCSAPKLFPIPLTWESAAWPRPVHARLPLPLCGLRACFAGCTDKAKPLTFLGGLALTGRQCRRVGSVTCEKNTSV